MMGEAIPLPSLETWDAIDDDADHATLVRADRQAKITVKRLSFADRGEGWLAKLWVKDRPYGRSQYAGDVAHDDPDVFAEKVRELAAEAPR